MNNRDGWESQLVGSALGFGLVLLIVGAILAAWLAVRAGNLVLRTVVRHPRNRPLWLALGVALLTSLLAAASGGHPLLLALAVATLGVLLVTARAVELYYDDRLQREPSRDLLIHDVLHEWWPA